jgi:hypothetical protein
MHAELMHQSQGLIERQSFKELLRPDASLLENLFGSPA